MAAFVRVGRHASSGGNVSINNFAFEYRSLIGRWGGNVSELTAASLANVKARLDLEVDYIACLIDPTRVA